MYIKIIYLIKLFDSIKLNNLVNFEYKGIIRNYFKYIWFIKCLINIISRAIYNYSVE